MTYIKRIIYCFSITFILLASLLVFFFTTTPGLYTAIKVVNLFLPGKIHLEKGTGCLMDIFSVKKLTYDDDTVLVKITMGHVNWQLKTLLHQQLTTILSADTVLIHIKDSTHINLRMLKPPFHFLISKLTINQLRVEHSSGIHSFNKLELQASFDHQRWVIDSLMANTTNQTLNLTANGQAAPPYPASVMLHFAPRGSHSPGVQGNIQLDGDLANYHWLGQFNGSIEGNFHGSLENGTELQTDAHWNKAIWPANSSNPLKSGPGHLTIHGTFVDFNMNATSQINSPVETNWQLTARIKNKQADINSTLRFPLSNLKTTINVKGTLYDTQHGKIIVSINPGTYQLPQGSPLPAIPFQGGDLSINITPEALQAKGMIAVDQNKLFHLALRIPKFRISEMKTTQQIDGKLDLQIKSLDFLQGLSKQIERIQGQLQMNLTATGTIAHPLVNGEIALTNGSVSIPQSGLTFAPIQIKLKSRNKQWQADGSITSLNHLLTLKGKGNFDPLLSGEVSILGDNVPIIKNTDYAINLSPQLAILFHPTTVDITGNILVPSAILKPVSFSNTVNLPEDVVFVNNTTKTMSPFGIHTDIQLTMGQHVALDIKGLHGFLDGVLHIKQSPQNALNASGELTIRKGRYKAYGQDLVIDQGQLMFTGGPIDNPGIHLRAIRKFNSANRNLANISQSIDFSAANIDTIDAGNRTTVGIEMTGHLNSHKITLFSIPASLSQSDILSMLLLGKPANQASQAGGQLLLTAISSMNLDSGTKGLQLLSQLKQTLGVDFNVQNNARYNQTTAQPGDNTAFVVSKSLTKKLFLSYNIGLLQNDSNVFTLKYLLSKFFSIQVNTSDSGSGLDLLYTH